MSVEKQTISAVIDGEGGYTEASHYLDDSGSRFELSQTAARYQLIGACLRGDTAVDTSELFNRIHSQLQDEPTVLAPAAMKRPVSGATRTAAGFAVAASVAAAVVFTVFRTQLPAETVQVADVKQPAEVLTLAAAPALVANSAAIDAVQVNEVVSQVEIDTGNPDLDRYLRAHQDYIGNGTFGPGFTTATMVSYDGN